MSDVCVESRDPDPASLAGSLLCSTEPELRSKVQALMARTPDLSSNGLGRSLNQEPDAHQCARGVLASSEGERQVRRALAWIASSGSGRSPWPGNDLPPTT